MQLEYNIDLTKEGIDNHPRIPIIDIGPPTNQGTSTELSSLTIFFICLGVLLLVIAISGLIACIVWSERSSSYDVRSSSYGDFDVPSPDLFLIRFTDRDQFLDLPLFMCLMIENRLPEIDTLQAVELELPRDLEER